MKSPTRREFLGAATAGVAALTLPRFLSGCGGEKVVNTSIVPPINPFLTWFGIDEAVISKVMKELTARGADAADLYFQHSRQNSITLEDHIVSKASSSVDLGVGLRVVVGDQTGYAFTEDLTIEAMIAAAQTASAIAHAGGGIPLEVFKYPEHRSLYQTSKPLAEVGIGDKLPLLQKIEALALQHEHITKVRVLWSDVEEHVLIADHLGNIHTDLRPMTRIWCILNAQKGEEVQSNSANLAGRRGFEFYDEEQIKFLVDEAVNKTMILFESKRPPAGELPVVLAAGASGILLHEAIGHGMEADFNRKGVSIFSDMIGKKVAEEFVTIVDSGVEPELRGSINFDDEGIPSERTVLVENGIMKSYMHDGISARHYNVSPTGSGRRESFRHVPIPRMRNTYMDNGPHTRDEIIASVEKGIIAETFTNGQVAIGAGDFTFYIKNGWMIEGGKITYPIKDCNIIGNGPDVLSKVSMVANDFAMDRGGWTCGKDGQSVPVSLGLPTILVSGITVGGDNA